MNPHKLIYDYLDGEITREDDKTLRELLKEDSELSREFQSILDLSYEIEKSNEDFIYPETFLDNFEENMVARMEADNAARKAKERSRKVVFGYAIAALPALFLLLVLSSYSITNLQTDLNKLAGKNLSVNKAQLLNEDEVKSIPEKTSNMTSDKIAGNKISNKIESNNISKNLIQDKHQNIAEKPNNNKSKNKSDANRNFVKTDKSIASSEQTSLKTGNNLEALDKLTTDNKKQINSELNSEKFMDFNSGTEKLKNASLENSNMMISPNAIIDPQFLAKNKINENLNNSSGLNTNFTSFSQTTKNSNVELNSFFGKDLISFGVGGTDQVVSSFTQSIAAKMDDYSRMGIESGFMQFSGDASMYTIIKKSLGTGIGAYSVENSGEQEILVRTKGTERKDKQLLWAGIFYERNLINFDNFSISSRMGIGASDVGFVSSLKIIGRYQIFNSVDFTLGADTKLFNGTQEFFTSKNSLSSTISFIYGIRFAF